MKEVIVALIGAAATIIVALITNGVKLLNIKRRRKKREIPDLTNTRWNGIWYIGETDEYVKDIIELGDWTGEDTIEGKATIIWSKGRVSGGYIYPIKITIYPQRVVLLTYTAEKFPEQALVGSGSLMLAANSKTLEGHWCGIVPKTESGVEMLRLDGGRVTIQKILN
jgi:hypothetical protein